MEVPPIWLAVQTNDLSLLKEHLTLDNINSPSANESYTLLMVAANRSFVEICAFLIEQGADVQAKSESGMTALMLAMNPNSETDSFKIASLIVDAGADVNAESGGGNTALMEAAHKGLTSVVELLIEKGALLDIQNKYGETALIVSSMEGGEPATVKALLKANARKDLKDVDGLTALDMANKNSCTEIASILA
jgi:ankyrin repeat protein